LQLDEASLINKSGSEPLLGAKLVRSNTSDGYDTQPIARVAADDRVVITTQSIAKQ
jgi:hypothetical protein